MAAADRQWLLCYQGLLQLCHKPDSQTASVDIELALQLSAKLTSCFVDLALLQPVAVIAQLNLTPRQFSPDAARLQKAMALALIYCRHYGWQAGRSQLLQHALLLSGAYYPYAATPQHAQLLAAKALQQYNKQHPLLPLLAAACNVRRQPPWLLHPDGPLLSLLSQLAQQLVPATGYLPGIEQLLTTCLRENANLIETHWFCLLQRLAASRLLPGRFAKEPDNSANSPCYWFICGQANTANNQDALMDVRQFEPASKTIAAKVQQRPLAALKLLRPQYFSDLNQLALLEHSADALPAVTAVSVQNTLEHSFHRQLPMLNLTAQVNKLETQPLISRFLQEAAQQISRQQLPVNRLRHAINMLGQEALTDWVAQAELHQLSCRLAHPHQHWLAQLQHCLQQALVLLSAAADQPLMSSKAGLVARCASISLWQLPASANIALGRQVQGQLLLAELIQQHIWQAADYPLQLKQLLLHYQYDDWAAAAQQWHTQQPMQLTVLLHLSWQLCLSVFCASEHNQQRLASLLPGACVNLAIPLKPASYWQQQLLAASHCYYPLATL